MYSQISANKRKTVLIFFFFLLVAAGLAWLFGKMYGSPSITVGVIIGGLIYSLISYYASSRLALAVNAAKQIEKKDDPRLWRIVENLSITDGLPTPKVYIMNDPSPNAFATGRDPANASV